MTPTITDLPVDAIVAGDNDRKEFDPTVLAQLAASIAAHGLAQPITVRPIGDGAYEVVAGERRLRAHRLLGRPTIPAIVRELDDPTTSALMLAENVHRVDLDPIEEANAYKSRMQVYGLSVEEVAEVANVTPRKVRDRLALLNLNPMATHLVRTGQMGLGHAILLAGLDADRQQLAVAAYAGGCTDWYEFDALSKKLMSEQIAQPMFDPDTFMQVEEYVLAAKAARRVSRRALLDLLRRVVDGDEEAFSVAADVLEREAA